MSYSLLAVGACNCKCRSCRVHARRLASLHMKPAPKSWPVSVATSPAVPGRRIERVNGPERARRVFFYKKNPRTLLKSTRNPGLLNGPAYLPLGPVSRRTWTLLGRIRPDDVFLFSCEFVIYLKRFKFCK